MLRSELTLRRYSTFCNSVWFRAWNIIIFKNPKNHHFVRQNLPPRNCQTNYFIGYYALDTFYLINKKNGLKIRHLLASHEWVEWTQVEESTCIFSMERPSWWILAIWTFLWTLLYAAVFSWTTRKKYWNKNTKNWKSVLISWKSALSYTIYICLFLSI